MTIELKLLALLALPPATIGGLLALWGHQYRQARWNLIGCFALALAAILLWPLS